MPLASCQKWPLTRSCRPLAPVRSAPVIEPMLMDRPSGMMIRFQAIRARLLAVGDLAVVLADQPRALRDQHGAAGGVVVDRLGHLGDHLARQVGVDRGDQGRGDDRAGLDLPRADRRRAADWSGSRRPGGGGELALLALAVLKLDVGGVPGSARLVPGRQRRGRAGAIRRGRTTSPCAPAKKGLADRARPGPGRAPPCTAGSGCACAAALAAPAGGRAAPPGGGRAATPGGVSAALTAGSA